MGSYNFQWSILDDYWPALLAGAWLDLWVSVVGFVLACAFGLVFALMRRSGVRLLAGTGTALVETARGIPPYVMLLWVHFGVSQLAGVAFSPFESILIVLAFTSAGYASEIFRSALDAVDRGQFEAAESLGLRRYAVYREVILPQCMRRVVAPLGNVMVGTLKTATLMGVIAVPDLMHQAQSINMDYFAPFEAFTAVLVIFVAMVFTISLLFLAIERALEYP
ncbi:amino acid ABC transporter permease [Verticiella sediminum]|uniref:Amino acid ABC transporter permease n=1 Tax=Verticiella sediminum TaxID=1247510 RepID=A0A556AIY8_9BURK|nr:amino acid ABC transporter permease [Verticiella sediminum]TSH92839.1 amino acid ABC transporter permease [Verticiella sediminum]